MGGGEWPPCPSQVTHMLLSFFSFKLVCKLRYKQRFKLLYLVDTTAVLRMLDGAVINSDYSSVYKLQRMDQ